MNNINTRWLQRFENYQTALARMQALVELAQQNTLDDVQQEALIQRFEYTQELSWKTIKDFYQAQGESDIQGSRDAFRLAFKNGLIEDGSAFMESIKSRNEAAHTYNQEIADKVYALIINKYYAAFVQLKQRLELEKVKRKDD
jgi:nucleotidyltransferase substrate binding protein (TIGR01987 family)